MNIYTWKKKGIFNPTYTLYQGNSAFWTIQPSESVLRSEKTQAALECTANADSIIMEGLTLSAEFAICDQLSKSILLNANLKIDLHNAFNTEIQIGTISTTSGINFEIVSERKDIRAYNQNRFLRTLGKSSVETTLSPSDSVMGAVLFACIAIPWKLGPFKSQPES